MLGLFPFVVKHGESSTIEYITIVDYEIFRFPQTYYNSMIDKIC